MARSIDYRGSLRASEARPLLVPDYAPDVPAEVAQANEEATAKVAALERADVAWGEASRVERGAREHDARAAAEAFERGTKPPKPTEQTAKETLAVAQRSRALSGRAADQALCHLHDLIVANRDTWMPAAQGAVDEATADVEEQITRLEETLVRQGELAALEQGLRRFDAQAESPKVRTLQRIGRPGRRGDPVEALLAQLVEAVQERVARPVEPTVEELQAAEELQERSRGLRQMASGRGGVHVS